MSTQIKIGEKVMDFDSILRVTIEFGRVHIEYKQEGGGRLEEFTQTIRAGAIDSIVINERSKSL